MYNKSNHTLKAGFQNSKRSSTLAAHNLTITVITKKDREKSAETVIQHTKYNNVHDQH